MNTNKSFIDKLNSFIFGEPIPILSQNDLDTIQNLNAKLDDLFVLLKPSPEPQKHPPLAGSPELSPNGAAPAAVEELTEQIRKLAKTQFKSNALQEEQLAQQQQTIAELQKAFEQQQKQLAEMSQQQQQAVEQARLELLKALLPIVDSLDAAFNTGRRQVLKLAMPAGTRQAVVAWLDGIRLARLRLLDVLKTQQVTPIPTIGEPFDPNRHVAVATDASGRAADGLIIGEDRRGYATPNKVLRYAEVVVAQSK